MNILNVYRKTVLSFTFVASALIGFAQDSPNVLDRPQTAAPEYVTEDWKPSLVRDGVYDRVPHVNKVLEWQPIREADVLWSKRVWREIDIRQKQNMPFRYPGDDHTGGGSFIEIIRDAVQKGKVKAYSTVDDRFTYALTKDDVFQIFAGRVDSTPVIDPLTLEETITVVRHDFNPDLVNKYRIKEDHIFDRNLGRMVVRIIGVAPLIDRLEEDGTFRASQPMFWLYYPELRNVLVQYEVYNPHNDMSRMTWDEFFEDRHFASYIIKVSNPFDATFSQMGISGTDLLFEGERVSEMLFNKEHDMWVY